MQVSILEIKHEYCRLFIITNGDFETNEVVPALYVKNLHFPLRGADKNSCK